MEKLNNEIMNHKELMSAINRLPILIPKRFPTASSSDQLSNYDELVSQKTDDSKLPAREGNNEQKQDPKRNFTETKVPQFKNRPQESTMERIVRETMTRHLANKDEQKNTIVVAEPTQDSIQTSITSVSKDMGHWSTEKEIQRRKLARESKLQRIQEEKLRKHREEEMKRKNLENERLRMNLEQEKKKIVEYQRRGQMAPLRGTSTKSSILPWRDQSSKLSTTFGEITPGWRSETEVVKAILAKRMTGVSGPEMIAKSGMSDVYLKTIRVPAKTKPKKSNKKIPFGSSLPRDLYSLWKIPNCQLPYCRPNPFKKTPDEIKVINTSPFAKPGESRSEELMRVGRAIISIPCRFRYTGSHGELRDRVLNTLQFETTLQDKAQAYIKAWEDFENHTKPFYSKADDACFLPKLSAALIDGCLKEGVDLGLRRVNSDSDLEPGVYRQRYGKEDVYEEEVVIVEKLTMEEIDRLRELPRRTLIRLFGSNANLNDELLEEKVLMLPIKPKRKDSSANRLKKVNEADETESAMMERVERKLRPSYHSVTQPPLLAIEEEDDIPEAFKKMVPKVKEPEVPNILKYFMDRRKEGERKEAERQNLLNKKKVTLPDWPTLVNSVMEENVPSTLKKLFLTKESEGFASSKESISKSSLTKPSLSKESVSRKSLSKTSTSKESVSRASTFDKSVKI
ncbi:unnamed protein product [Orchesella dallaii]|uniref:Uncharacterized protein n=1 Tax=Orchesella dallaii TaxID=48710 RepID=A0ABP1PM25_9HEXA